MTNIIEVKNLRKFYGENEAVKGISFSVEQGTLFAFLGTNGAGKSTTIEILCTLLQPSSGDIIINGSRLGTIKGNTAIRTSIGIVFQKGVLDDLLTVKENILLRGRNYKLTKQQLEENYQFVKEYLHLEEIENYRYGKLSGGQKRRADIARAIIHKPKILFLDEPTTGLDPQTRQFVWEAIERLRKETNMTIFLTTHYMEEATVANHIVVIKKGEIIAQGSPNELKDQFASDYMIIKFQNDQLGEEHLNELNANYIKLADVYRINMHSTLEALPILRKCETNLISFEVIKGTLDDVFIQINAEKEAI